MRPRWTIFVYGLILFAGVLIVIHSVEGAPPFVKDGAPTVITFEEDTEYDGLDLYDVFTDDDPEDQLLNLSQYDVKDINVSIDQTTGGVLMSGAEDFHGEVNVTFRAEDGIGYFVIHTIRVVILPVNDPPMPMGRIPRKIWEEGDISFINVSRYFEDVEGDALYYYAEPDPDHYTFVNADNDPLNPWFDILCQDVYFYGFIQVTFRACDRDPVITGEDTVWAIQEAIFEVEGVNNRPVVAKYEPEEPNLTVRETEQATFAIVSVEDPDSSTFTYKWYVDGEEVQSGNDEAFTFPDVPSHDDAGTYKVTVQVSDSMFARAGDPTEWTLTILDVNRVPDITLQTADMKVEQGEAITLEAIASDQDGDEIAYRWFRSRDRKGARVVGFGDQYVHRENLSPGRYHFRCEVSDGKDTTVSDWVTITVEQEDRGATASLAFLSLLVAFLALATVYKWRRRHSKAY